MNIERLKLLSLGHIFGSLGMSNLHSQLLDNTRMHQETKVEAI